MPGAGPTWAKWVGQAHLACSLPRKALLKSRLCSCSCAAGSHSSPRKTSFPGGPAGKCLIILDSLLSSSIQEGGSVWWVRGTALVDVIYEYGFKWYFLLTCCLVYRWPLPGVGVWDLGSRLSTWMELLSGPWVSPWPLSQRPSQYRKVTERLLHLWVHSFYQVSWAQADVSWTKVMASK